MDIKVKVRKGKDPYFRHVHVLQEKSRNKTVRLLLFMLLLGVFAYALYTLRPAWEWLDPYYAALDDAVVRFPPLQEDLPAPELAPQPDPAAETPATQISKTEPPIKVAENTTAISPRSNDEATNDTTPGPPDRKQNTREEGKIIEPLPVQSDTASPATTDKTQVETGHETMPNEQKKPPVTEPPPEKQEENITAGALPLATENPESPPLADNKQEESPAQTEKPQPHTPSSLPAAEQAAEEQKTSEPARQKETEIKALLKTAYEQIGQMHLSRPQGDNAYETYQTLHKIDPSQAARVLDSIMLQYLNRAKAAAEEQDFQKTYALYQEAAQLGSDHQIIQALFGEAVKSLAALGQAQIDAGRMQGEESAYATYQELYRLAPEHETTRQLLESLLKTFQNQAMEQIKQRKYTTPKHDNAYDTQLAMEAIAPGNPWGKMVLNEIAEQYALLATDELRKNRLQRSLSLVQRGLKAAPEHAKLLSLKETLDAYSSDPNQRLLNHAEQHLAAGRLVKPAGNNAYEAYQQILNKSPNDQRAHEGIKRIADAYEQMAKVRHARGALSESRGLVKQGLEVSPQHAGLLELQSILNAEQE